MCFFWVVYSPFILSTLKTLKVFINTIIISYLKKVILCMVCFEQVIQDIAFSEDSHWLAVSSSRGTNHLFAISPFGGAAKPSANGTDHVFGAMTPWWSNVGPIKSSQQASSLAPPATVNSSVISRIKNGNNGWRGTVMDAASTTSSSGRTTSFGAAVAVSFHDGQVYKLEVDGVQNGLKEQLWVLSPSGHLIRYGLRFLADTEGYTDSAPSQIPTVEALDVRVVVEPLQKWDVCRRPTWVEREEKIDNSVSNVSHDVPSCANVGSCYNNGAFSDREDFISSEMRQFFLSNAEVSMHHFKPPVWAKPQVCVKFCKLSGSPWILGILLPYTPCTIYCTGVFSSFYRYWYRWGRECWWRG